MLVAYTRFEAVPSPVLVQTAAATLGESSARLVLRSNYNLAATSGSQRHVVPPAAAEMLAETHGMFDVPLTDSRGHTRLDRAAYATIVARDEGALPEIAGTVQLVVPYLPDPLARGVTLSGLPGSGGKDMQIAFAGTWPAVGGFRLAVQEGKANRPPHWDAAARVLTVYLAKAEQVTIMASSYLSVADVGVMGMCKWLDDCRRSTPALLDMAVQGAHSMITPARAIRLVHAVQQPLLEPEYRDLSVFKVQKGDTFAVLDDLFPIDGKSTAKFEVVAEWDEPVDDLNKPKWEVRHGKARALEVIIEPVDEDVVLSPGADETGTGQPRVDKHEFGDTKHRRVMYGGVATTRFAEYFPQGTTPLTRPVTRPVTLSVPSSARPPAPVVQYVLPTFDWSTFEEHKQASGDGTYSRAVAGPRIISRRSGNGLRVYLDRPWFSSGDGELVGVVYSSAASVPESLKPLVTRWGADPIYKSGSVHTSPREEHFKNTAAHAHGLTLDEVTGPTFSVAAYKPDYDEERGLWYADIEIEAGTAYFPFVRLALARYQPAALPGCHLSRVVLADFAQLTATRTASVAFDTVDPHRVTVRVGGIRPRTQVLAREVRQMQGPGSGHTQEIGPLLADVLPVYEVALEEKEPSGSNFGWAPVLEAGPHGTSVPFLRMFEPNKKDPQGYAFSAKLALPEPALSRPYRLVIREYELFSSDDDQSGTGAGGAGKLAGRLVYADAIELR